DRFENRKGRLVKIYERAEAAYQMNLAGVALQTLLESNPDAFGAEGTRLQIELGLHTGRVREVSAWLDLDDEEEAVFRRQLGDARFSRIKAQLAGVRGDCAAAERMYAGLTAE